MAEHLASIFGTEKDRVNCPFYFKIGCVASVKRAWPACLPSRQRQRALWLQVLLCRTRTPSCSPPRACHRTRSKP